MRINAQLIIKDSLTKDFFNKQPKKDIAGLWLPLSFY